MSVQATRTQPFVGSYLMPSLDRARVSDAMHPGVLACDPELTLPQVARLMASHHIHCVALMATVQDGGAERFVWNLITDADLLRSALQPGIETAGEMASGAVTSIEPDTPLRDAAEAMVAHRTSHLLVIDPERQRPIGVLSSLDIAGVLAWGEG